MSIKPGTTTGPAGIVHSALLTAYMVYDQPLNDDARAKILISMHEHCRTPVNNDFVIKEIERKKYFIEHQFRKSATPQRVFKMLKSDHADALCKRGCIGLGPLTFYKSAENKRISDEYEGTFPTLAEGKRYSICAISGVGSHVLVYCTTTDPGADFGYDACVEISQPAEFFQVATMGVANHFRGRNQLVRVEHSRCVYQHSRVITGRLHGFNEDLIHLGELSVDTIDVLSHGKYLVKERLYAGDSEYRFVFVMRADVSNYTAIECPELAKFCRRIR